MGRKERAGPPDEKVTINLGPVDVGRIDLLVEEGFFGSRTDLIRTAVRNLLDEHKESLNDAIVRHAYNVGVVVWPKSTFEELRKKNERVNLRVVGVLRIPHNVSPDLADAVIESIRVLGHLSAPAGVRQRLEPKMVGRDADA
jgi:Arc/MetJ-type ribon-helix-helix transcriptional regulator